LEGEILSLNNGFSKSKISTNKRAMQECGKTAVFPYMWIRYRGRTKVCQSRILLFDQREHPNTSRRNWTVRGEIEFPGCAKNELWT
jgi:hypothetical protein